ncbi:hypothetical protein C1H46_009189 [Malus baccata]|uniref:DUF1764 domain-containing protein n=1 Tax=Malus baccata TaxID=106549 RepID=A0A540N3W3_MALBA|nr:hypothetical protein C1H46_009189 [Malus baccata]
MDAMQAWDLGSEKMGKKSKSKAPREVKDDKVVEEEKRPSSVKRPTSEVDETSAKKRKKPETEKGEKSPSSAKKPASEIDDIFAAKKKKTETGKTKKPRENATEKPHKLKTKKKDKGIRDGGFGDLSSQPKKRTQDGLAVYTEDELGINNADAGNTPLCPFDCSCCF